VVCSQSIGQTQCSLPVKSRPNETCTLSNWASDCLQSVGETHDKQQGTKLEHKQTKRRRRRHTNSLDWKQPAGVQIGRPSLSLSLSTSAHWPAGAQRRHFNLQNKVQFLAAFSIVRLKLFQRSTPKDSKGLLLLCSSACSAPETSKWNWPPLCRRPRAPLRRPLSLHWARRAAKLDGQKLWASRKTVSNRQTDSFQCLESWKDT